jgi:beta-ribofuranosylaminobenzene 5'-phosphate synthase
MTYGVKALSINSLSIEICPRIHLGLISMHAGAARKNGGVGFALNGPHGVVSVARSSVLRITDERINGFNSNELDQISAIIQHAADGENLPSLIDVRLHGSLATHIGMGSGTAFRLAILEALFLANSREITEPELIRYSGRGGTSGIGINTYFSGGLVFDLGVQNNSSKFMPSSKAAPTSYPLTVGSQHMPAWALCICVPNWLPTKTQDQEIEFFERVTPLPAPASFETAYHALFGVYASVVEANYANFCLAVEAMQQVQWKQLEWLEYGQSLFALRDKLRQFGANCVGMSSLGPMLFCFANVKVLQTIECQAADLNCRVWLTEVSNHGRKMKSVVDA